jgi:2,3-bisphosphoglycerate-independent phosphoglycerate mutase
MPPAPKSPLVLCILDGWGCREPAEDNAIHRAHTPFYDSLLARYPHSRIETSGEAVGLPAGQMGNSEVGHMTIGIGRILMQSLPRIDAAFASGEVKAHAAIRNAVALLKGNGGRLHLVGMVSTGGVHSHQDHIAGLAEIFATEGIEVYLHIITDGRDVSPKSGADAVEALLSVLEPYGGLIVPASVSGRYYAMDRDNRQERTQAAYDAIAEASSPYDCRDPLDYIRACYERDVYDEFLPPAVLRGAAPAEDGDVFLMANFRADRMRQLAAALTAEDKTKAICMTEYDAALSDKCEILFPPQPSGDILGEILERSGMTQLRIAETEKYAHVTFFFNSGREAPFTGEDRILVPSPRIATYDLKPEMSAFEVTDRLLAALPKYDVVVLNYANADMVGHTGNFTAAAKAVEAIDACLAKLVPAVLSLGGSVLITADHGNVEQMTDAGGGPHTSHTTLPVPLIHVSPSPGKRLRDGRLCDIAPTMLDLLGIEKPTAMTGESLQERVIAG